MKRYNPLKIVVSSLILLMIIAISFYFIFSSKQTIIILRHGQAENNIKRIYNSDPQHPNYKIMHLTNVGKQQITETAKKIESLGINKNNVVICVVSPLPRALESAEILIKNNVVKRENIIIDERLIESNLYDLEGLKVEPSHFKPWKGESFLEVKDRVVSLYNEIIKQYPTGNIIFVTHGVPATQLYNFINNVESNKFEHAEFRVIQ